MQILRIDNSTGSDATENIRKKARSRKISTCSELSFASSFAVCSSRHYKTVLKLSHQAGDIINSGEIKQSPIPLCHMRKT